MLRLCYVTFLFFKVHSKMYFCVDSCINRFNNKATANVMHKSKFSSLDIFKETHILEVSVQRRSSLPGLPETPEKQIILTSTMSVCVFPGLQTKQGLRISPQTWLPISQRHLCTLLMDIYLLVASVSITPPYYQTFYLQILL